MSLRCRASARRSARSTTSAPSTPTMLGSFMRATSSVPSGAKPRPDGASIDAKASTDASSPTRRTRPPSWSDTHQVPSRHRGPSGNARPASSNMKIRILYARHAMAGVSFDGQVVTFSACFNFRELGGYPTAGGTAVRRGQLYRSDSLHRLSGADLDRLAALGIRTVLDLRGVPDDVIAADYVLSVDSRRARDAYLREHEPERAAFFASLPASVLAIDASTMEQFLRELRARHGSVRALLEAGGAPAAALDRLVDDLVDRAME